MDQAITVQPGPAGDLRADVDPQPQPNELRTAAAMLSKSDPAFFQRTLLSIYTGSLCLVFQKGSGRFGAASTSYSMRTIDLPGARDIGSMILASSTAPHYMGTGERCPCLSGSSWSCAGASPSTGLIKPSPNRTSFDSTLLSRFVPNVPRRSSSQFAKMRRMATLRTDLSGRFTLTIRCFSRDSNWLAAARTGAKTGCGSTIEMVC